jgi:hypothetical protein
MRTTETALLFVARLIEAGTSIEVSCHTNGIDVVTPFELQPDLFPEESWLR